MIGIQRRCMPSIYLRLKIQSNFPQVDYFIYLEFTQSKRVILDENKKKLQTGVPKTTAVLKNFENFRENVHVIDVKFFRYRHNKECFPVNFSKVQPIIWCSVLHRSRSVVRMRNASSDDKVNNVKPVQYLENLKSQALVAPQLYYHDFFVYNYQRKNRVTKQATYLQKQKHCQYIIKEQTRNKENFMIFDFYFLSAQFYL